MADNLDWMNIDQTPDNPYGKGEDYEAFLNYLGALPRPLTPALAAGVLRINVSELNNHPDFKQAAIDALAQWSAVTPLRFEIVDDAPYNPATDYMQVVSPEVGEEDDGSAYSSGRYVSVGQKFHDTENDPTTPGSYIFDTFIHEFGHEFGLNHPGLYNYSGPGGVQINYLNNATWIYDRQQYSVMSYFDGIDVGEFTRWAATTPMMGDIEAVIRRFYSTVVNGERVYQDIQLNTGDDTYGFGSDLTGYTLTATGETHDIGFVIHDTGGEDTIDFSGSTAGTILDLRAGRFSSVNGHSNNVSIFAGHNEDQEEYYIERGIGSRFADTILGNDGDNELIGGAGDDRLAGFAGNDDLDGGAGADEIYAHAGDDTIVGGSGNDHLDGGDGADVIQGGAGDDVIIGGRDSLASRDINNTIPFEDLEDQTESFDGNDRLYGGAGNDIIEGGQGNDLLDGGAGDDILRGQDGVDVFRGGDGVDTVDFSHESPFQLLVNLATNTANGGTATGDTFYSIENLIGSDDRIDRFIGTDADNHFWGQGGGDVFNGGGGNDILDGGNDGDMLSGDAGDDIIIGGSGQDAIDGGAGNDTAVYTGSNAGVTIDLTTGRGSGGDAEGPIQIVGRGTLIRGEYITGIENVTGSEHDDRLIGDALVNRLLGAEGDDTLAGGGGADYLDGGDGLDTADFSSSTSAVDIDLEAGETGEDTFVSIEGLSGSAFDDSLTGDAGANRLIGQGGNDTLVGGAGDDVLSGDFPPGGPNPTEPGIGMGTGYTVLPAGSTNNSFATALDLTENFSLAADADIWDATTIPHTTVNATGNGEAGYYAVTLNAGSILSVDIDRTTNPAFDSFILLVDEDGNVVAASDDAAGDPGSTQRTDSMLTFAIAATAIYYIVVGSYDNDGPGGFIPVVNDGASYEVNVSVDFQPGPPTPGTAGNDTLDGGDGNDTLNGGAGDDILIGGAGNDTLNGDAGSDQMTGNTGDDIYTVDDAGDVIVENAVQGTDRVNSSVTYTLGLNVERLYLTGTDDINGTGNAVANWMVGNAGDNVIRGGSGSDTISGGAGNDRLIGDSGNDTLRGGAGNDTLTGGTGADTFVFNTRPNSTTNTDRITDFSVVDDTIALDDLYFAALSVGTLAASAFSANAAGIAQDASDRIIYETDTGRLLYDNDGTAAGVAVLFATLNSGLALTANDFVVI